MKKQILILFFIILNISLVLAASFTWDHAIPDNFTLIEDVPFSFDFNVSCDESLVNYSVYIDSGDTSTILRNISENGLFQYTADNDDNTDFYYERGIRVFNISNPMSDKLMTGFIPIYIINTNDVPIVLNQSWQIFSGIEHFNSTPVTEENQTICFTAFFNDIDSTNDELNVTWFNDDVFQAVNNSIQNPSPGSELNVSYCFLPDFESAGEYTINATICDNNFACTYLIWNLTITAFNREPIIYWHFPSNESNSSIVEESTSITSNITINETGNITFCANYTDPDGNSLNGYWYFDGGSPRQSNYSTNNSCYTYFADYDDADTNYSLLYPLGIHIVRLSANDIVGSPSKSDYHYWFINITNVNRIINITGNTGDDVGGGGSGGGHGGIGDADGDLENFSYYICNCSDPCNTNNCTWIYTCNVSLDENNDTTGDCTFNSSFNITLDNLTYEDSEWQIDIIWQTNFSDAGTYKFLIEALDAENYGHVRCSNCFDVGENLPPIIINSLIPSNVCEGDTINFNFTSTDSDSNMYRAFIYLDSTLLYLFDLDSNLSLNRANENFLYSYRFNYTVIDEIDGKQEFIINYSVEDFEPLWDYENFTFNLTEKNDIPDINFTSFNNSILVQNTFRYLNFTNSSFDEDNLLIDLIWNCSSNSSNSDINLSMNNSIKILKVTALDDFIGLTKITCDLNDSRNITQANFILNITQNSPPNISIDTPLGINIIINETDTLDFNHSSYDLDNDTLSYTWFLDSVIYSSSANISIYFNYTSAGNHNITLQLSDGNFYETRYWNVSVLNLNLLPYYAPEIDLFNHSSFSLGTFQNLSYALNLSLNISDGNYSYQGIYTSPIIEFQESRYYASFNFTNTTIINTSISCFARSGYSSPYNNGSWSEWTSLENSYDSLMHSEGQYFQYKIMMATNDTSKTPSIQNLFLKKYLRNSTINTQILENWVDLDNFFNDDDVDDTLVYTAHGYNNILVIINNITNSVTLNSNNNNNLRETIYFMLNDSYDVVTSQNITINFNISADSGGSSNESEEDTEDDSSSSGGGGSSTQTISVTHDVYSEPLEITIPDPLTISANRTVYFVIDIKNNLNQTLNDLKLDFECNVGICSLFQSQLDLNASQKKSIEGQFSAQNNTGNHVLKLLINSSSPEFIKTEYLYVTALLKDISIKDELLNKLKFAKQLVSNNPICGELINSFTQINENINSSNFEKADLLLESSIKSCNDLVNYDLNIDQEKIIYEEKDNTWKTILISVILFLFLIFLFLFINNFRKKRRLTKTIEQENKKTEELDSYISKFNN